MFDNLFKKTDAKGISGLTDELKVLYLINRFKKEKRSFLLVTNSLYEASAFYDAIKNYIKEVFLFPMDDFLTSEALAVSPEFKITRLETLKELTKKEPSIVVTNLMGYLRYLPRSETYLKNRLILKKDSDYSVQELIQKFYQIGYTREAVVNKTGELAVRGFVVDIFPVSFDNPIRIEFWGDTIDSIREFDVDTQLTLKALNEITIDPNTEFLTQKEKDVFGLKQKDLINEEEVVNITSYLDHPIVVFQDQAQIKKGYELLQDEIFHYNLSLELKGDTKYMHDLDSLRPEEEFYFTSFDNEIKGIKFEHYESREIEPFHGTKAQINERLNTYLKEKKKVIICLNNRYKVNKLIEDLENDKLIFTDENTISSNHINVIVKKIQSGFQFQDLIVISEKELFHKENHSASYKTNFKFGKKVRDLTKLNKGDYVVHSVHGIGRYIGIKTLTVQGLKKDYLQIEYKDGDKLYIPVEKIEFISKYSSNEGIIPKLNKLGSTEWEKTKLRVKKKIEDIAGELLKLYAEREASEGFAFQKDTEEQLEFEKEFTYSETEDQLRVTEEIKNDMEDVHPMDRLLCGDVGFGKTEVAFRAMMKAVLSGKQVALLCPTTILSSQHYQNAIERFKSFAVNIKLLNRFVSYKETTQILKDLKEGKIDILIGTHRILGEDVEFKDLGLLIIDEEQRFGVKHKEKIKQYKNNIDVLTLSATPIPRTLQMSLAGIRNLSLIETPPMDRFPVQTYVLAENKEIIKDAIYKELSRKGQVFILYNHIDDMERKVEEIKSLVPEAKMISAHGRMEKDALEDVMMKFQDKEYDVLLCTTIIESGIDIPNVNTLIVMDADRFGLSQLYQIRGRVGRSNKIAYCYLMYDKSKILSEVATKRLSVIKEFTELGSGFAIAVRDLSIRGAGDILGSEQAGFIDSVGVELYLSMLNEEIAKLKGQPIEKKEEVDIQPLLNVETSIDDTYVSEEELKIEIHKKINQIDSYSKLYEVKEELEDRFGKLSESMIIYMYEEWFEKLAHKLNIKKVNQTRNYVEIILDKEMTSKVNGELLFLEANRISRMFRFSMKFGQLSIILDTIKLEKHFIYYLIELMEVLEKAL